MRLASIVSGAASSSAISAIMSLRNAPSDDKDARPLLQPPRLWVIHHRDTVDTERTSSGATNIVVPAKAGTHQAAARTLDRWIPAFTRIRSKFLCVLCASVVKIKRP